MKYKNLQDEIKNKVVFAVGNNNYQDKEYPNLTKCENDAEGIFGLFLDKKYFKVSKQKSILLTSNNYDVSKNLVLDNLERVANSVNTEEQLIIYFSGHGEQVEGEFGLVLYDTNASDLNTYLKISEIEGVLSRCKCKTRIAIFDACCSGTDLHGNKSVMPTRKTMEELIRESRGMIILSSSTAHQPSNEQSPSKYSLFTHFLLEGLSGNAVDKKTYMIDLYECYKYAAHKMQDYARSVGLEMQIPAINMINEGIVYLGCFLENDESYIWFEDNFLRIDITEIPNENTNYFEEIYSCLPEDLFDLLNACVFEIIHNAFRHGGATKAEIYILKNEIRICDNGVKFNLFDLLETPVGGGSVTAKEIRNQEELKSVEYSFVVSEKKNQYTVSFHQDLVFDIRYWTIANNNEMNNSSFDRICKYYFWFEDNKKSQWFRPMSLSIRDIIIFIENMPKESTLLIADNSSLGNLFNNQKREPRILTSEIATKYLEKYSLDHM